LFGRIILPILGVLFTPGSHLVDPFLSTPIALIFRLGSPALLAQKLAGRLAYWIRAEPLMMTIPRIGRKQLFAAGAPPAATFGFHRPLSFNFEGLSLISM